MMRRIVTGAALVAFAATAALVADTAMAQVVNQVVPVPRDGGIINVGSILGPVAAPYVNAAIDGVLATVFGWVMWVFKNKLHVDVSKQSLDAIQIALSNRAHSLVADGAVKVGELGRISVGSTALAAAANDLIAKNKDAVAQTGITPEAVQAAIVDHLSKVPAIAQAQAARIMA